MLLGTLKALIYDAFQRLYVDTYLAICGHLPCKIFSICGHLPCKY